jgi:hypothetical protein
MRAVLRILFWVYERGSWQYDVLCALILAFIFLTPKTVFDGSAFSHNQRSPEIEEKTSGLAAVLKNNEYHRLIKN